jgi:hypothetical protein
MWRIRSPFRKHTVVDDREEKMKTAKKGYLIPHSLSSPLAIESFF